jgi:hypothetical protein
MSAVPEEPAPPAIQRSGVVMDLRPCAVPDGVPICIEDGRANDARWAMTEPERNELNQVRGRLDRLARLRMDLRHWNGHCERTYERLLLREAELVGR